MPIRSVYEPAPIPNVSVTTFVTQAMASRGSEPLFIDGPSGRTWTVDASLGAVGSIARSLLALGLRHQERVAFVVPNLPESALAYHGVVAAGGIAAMLNPLSTPRELAVYFGKLKPRFVFTVAAFAANITDQSLSVFVIGEASFAALLDAEETLPSVAIDPENDVAVMPFSSGTTGFPKGVMLTHRNLVAQCLALASVTDAPIVVDGSRLIAVLPFFHIYGIVAFLTYGIVHRATIVTMPRFDFPQFIDLARAHEVPILHIVPPIALAIARAKIPVELPNVIDALVGAAPLGPTLAAEYVAKMGTPISQVYGMTEVCGASHLGRRTKQHDKPNAVGQLIGGLEAKLIHVETREEVARGETGELCVRGPIVMRGYLDDEAATREAIDADGWLHTGDVGYLDEDGDLWLVDRSKELIKWKGMQVAPAALESLLLGHPAIADVAVYAIPDEEAGEIPKATIVLRAGVSATADEIMQYVRERVAPHMRVRAVEFSDTIPKSASGKILRRLLAKKE